MTRTFLPGAEIGDGYGSRGTFCCFVRSIDPPGNIHLLSTAHVIADEGLAPLGFPVTWTSVQGGGQLRTELRTEIVARLSRFEPVAFSSSGYKNRMDAAIASVEEAFKPSNLSPLPVSDAVHAGMKVRYCTPNGLIQGTVLDADYDFAMFLKLNQTEVSRAGFRSHVLCDIESLGGDSGSAVVDENDRLIGIHVAGNDDGAIFTRIVPILSAFRVTAVGRCV